MSNIEQSSMPGETGWLAPTGTPTWAELREVAAEIRPGSVIVL